MNILQHKKFLLIAVPAVAVLLFAVAAVVLFSNKRPAPPEITPGPSPAPTAPASPSLLPGQVGNLEQVQRQDPQDKNPVLNKLPKKTDFWTLDVKGRDQNGYILIAHVFYVRGQDPQAAIDRQRPYIEQFVKSTGQPDGTYTIQYATTLF